jgi:hypothetical protein
MKECIYQGGIPDCGVVECGLDKAILRTSECSTCKDRVPVDWNTCPEKIVRNNEEDLCKLSGDVCYMEECNNKVIRRR